MICNERFFIWQENNDFNIHRYVFKLTKDNNLFYYSKFDNNWKESSWDKRLFIQNSLKFYGGSCKELKDGIELSLEFL